MDSVYNYLFGSLEPEYDILMWSIQKKMVELGEIRIRGRITFSRNETSDETFSTAHNRQDMDLRRTL